MTTQRLFFNVFSEKDPYLNAVEYDDDDGDYDDFDKPMRGSTKEWIEKREEEGYIANIN